MVMIYEGEYPIFLSYGNDQVEIIPADREDIGHLVRLIVLFSGKIVGPVQKVKHSEGPWEQNPGQNIYLLCRKFVILAPNGQSVRGEAGG